MAKETQGNKSLSETELDRLGEHEMVTPPNYSSTCFKRKRNDEPSIDFSQLKEEIKAMINASMVTQLREIRKNTETLKEIQETNKNIEHSIEFLSAQNEELCKKIQVLEKQSAEDKKYIVVLEDKVEELTKNSRKSNLEIKNVPKKSNETKEDLINITEKLSQSINCPISKADIKDVYRVRGKQEGPQAAPIIVETSSSILKTDILKMCKVFNTRHSEKLRAKHLGFTTSEETPIYVSEQLTPKAARLYFLARELKRQKEYKFCWRAYDDADETQGKARYPVLPSLIALQQMRNRLATAKSGRRLMQWSALATGAELRRIAKELAAVYVSFGEEVADAFMLLARSRYFYPNLNKMVIENNPAKACVTVGRNFRSIAGCKISTFGIEDNCSDSYPHLAIDRGGDTVTETKKAWYELLRKLIWMIQLRSNYISLHISHDQTNKKSKVLGKIIIPRTQVTIRYILSELEELEREEFFRLKKVLEVKYRHKKKAPKKEVEVQVEEEVEECPYCKMEEEKDTCVVCGGPMHPSDWKPMTVEQADKERAAIADIKENLDRVLAATEHYEKTTPRKESLLETFKQTTTELKSKLRTRIPPACIPDDVDVEKLCDICKEMYKQQQSNKETEEECPECIKEREKKEKATQDGSHQVHIAPETCIVCNGPMHPSDQKPMTAEQIRKENDAISNIKDNLDRVLAATEHYEKTASKKDSILKDFKQTTAELKNKLQTRIPPASIPEDVNIEKLCDLCKEMHKEQYAKCVVCDQAIAGVDDKMLAAAKESRKQFRKQLETVLGTIQKYESEGMEANKLKEFKQSAAELKKKLLGPPIPNNVNIEKLCADCKDRMNDSDHSAPIKFSHVQEIPKKSISKQDLTPRKSVIDKLCEDCKERLKESEPDSSKKSEYKQVVTPSEPAQHDRKQGLCEKHSMTIKPPTPLKSGSAHVLGDKHSLTSKPPSLTKTGSAQVVCEKHSLTVKPPTPPKSSSKQHLCEKHSAMSKPSTPSKSGSKQELGVKHSKTSSIITNRSVTNSVVSSDLPLGVFETEEITEVIQVKNPDGTVTEKRRVVTIKRKPGAAERSTSATSSYRDKKVGLVSVIVNRKRLTKRPGDSQSEYAIKSLPMVDHMIKACISSQWDCGYDEAVQNVTELSSEIMLASLNERNSNSCTF